MMQMPQAWTRNERGTAAASETLTPATAGADTKPDWALSRREAERVLRERAGLPPLRRRRWPLVIFVLVLLGGLGAAGFWLMQQRGNDAALAAVEVASEPEAPTMELVPAEYQVLDPVTLVRTVRVTGTLTPTRRAQLSSQTGGLVEEVTVQPGDAVEKGDLLVQVDVETLTIDLDLTRSNTLATRSQLELAEAQLERTEALLDRGVATSSTLQEARSNVEGLRANLTAQQDQVRAAELRLANATVRAPFDGVVSSRDVDPGQYVSIGAPLVTVVDLSSVEMQANAPVAAGARLEVGQPVEVSVDGIPGRTFAGRVERINPVASEGSRTIPVYVGIDNSQGMLLGGMFATGQVVTEQVEDAIAVPASAVREGADGAHVLRIAGERLERAPVETGGEWAGELVRVSQGLAPGDVIVTAPLSALDAGAQVTLLED